jgi:hypothetical protein
MAPASRHNLPVDTDGRQAVVCGPLLTRGARSAGIPRERVACLSQVRVAKPTGHAAETGAASQVRAEIRVSGFGSLFWIDPRIFTFGRPRLGR